MLSIHNRFLTIIFLLFISAACNYSEELSGKVIAIKDGDTIEILVNNKPVRIRLYGIDAPEKRQAFGREVRVIVKDTDRYGRSVGVVILPDGKNLNCELVRQGYAWWYRQYSKDPAFESYESEARRKHLGLWVDPDPKAPWDFRRGGISKSKMESQKREVAAAQCKGTTKAGKQCTRKADQSGYCWQHRK